MTCTPLLSQGLRRLRVLDVRSRPGALAIGLRDFTPNDEGTPVPSCSPLVAHVCTLYASLRRAPTHVSRCRIHFAMCSSRRNNITES